MSTALLPEPELTLPGRFQGPPTSSNGGYAAGRLASYLPAAAAVQVALRQPPPLETPLRIEAHGPAVRAVFGGVVVAEAVPASLDVEPVEPVSFEEATQAGRRYRGLDAHPFPSCFSCGTARPDGLRLQPGPLPGRAGTTAAAWRPDAALAAPGAVALPAELVWAALDCPGGWTVELTGRPAVLGRITVSVDALPQVADRCVVMGRLLGTEGRRSYTATTLYDGDGRVLGRAHAVWVTVDLDSFGSS